MPKHFLFLIFWISLTTFSAQEANLVGKFTFNKGKPLDDLGKNKVKAYGVDLTEDRFGNVGMAYYFHGSADSYLNLGTNALLKPLRGSISLWMNIHGLMGLGKGVETNPIINTGKGVETNPIINTRSHGGEDCNQAYYLGVDLNTKRMNGSITSSCDSGTTLYSKKEVSLGKWHHVVLTYDDKCMKLYLDGEFQYESRKNFRSVFLDGDSVMIGKIDESKNTRFFLGCVDDIYFYDRVLTAAEVINLYHEPNPKKSKIILQWAGIILAFILLLILIIFLIRKRIQKLVNREKEKNQLQNNWYEQENRVLAAQMDPHFIFNSLNTIQQFIITNENETAQIYLSKFSKLIRKLIESNTKENVSLKEEIEIFEKYIEIESLRFNNVFKYTIHHSDNIEPSTIFIPHFLIQPLIENAIWHGLLAKEGEKNLDISFELVNEKTLLCVVEDNGVGRINARKKNELTEKKSLAINFIRQRLQLVSKILKENYSLTIEDKVNENGESLGTKASITIPILNKQNAENNNY